MTTRKTFSCQEERKSFNDRREYINKGINLADAKKTNEQTIKQQHLILSNIPSTDVA